MRYRLHFDVHPCTGVAGCGAGRGNQVAIPARRPAEVDCLRCLRDPEVMAVVEADRGRLEREKALEAYAESLGKTVRVLSITERLRYLEAEAHRM